MRMASHRAAERVEEGTGRASRTDRVSQVTRAKTLLGPARAASRAGDGDGATWPEVARALGAIYSDSTPFMNVAPQKLAQEVCDRVADRARSKRVDIVLHCSCDVVRVQPHTFSAALYELVDNAVQATKPGHPVIVDVRETRERDVLWQVQDGGAGMSERVLAELGRPSRPPLAIRSCMGVPIAWAVVELHGGLIRFESGPGVGTTVSIWLPGHHAATGRRMGNGRATQPAPTAAPSPRAQGERSAPERPVNESPCSPTPHPAASRAPQ